MLFAVLVLDSEVGEGELIFEIAAFVILASIVAHGLTDTVGARWIEKRMEEIAEGEGDAEAGPVPGAV